MTSLAASLIVALSLAESAGPHPAGPTLNVPYLAQTGALCGGAAAAMIFRYWGDRHADVQQFAPLVDRKAGGIADDVLIDAIRQRQWQAFQLNASLDTVRDRLSKGQPLILLLEDRRGRYHYVVAVGADEEHVYVHDPAWGPSRRFTIEQFQRAWKPSNFWALLVLPGSPSADGHEPPGLNTTAALTTSGSEGLQTSGAGLKPSATGDGRCDQLLDEAVAEIGRRGLASADDLLDAVRALCPDASRPMGELAAVRFAERRWREAEALAEDAVRRDPANQYAWDVLGSSRFMQDDSYGALDAWNRIGKPRLDSVDITGLTHTRYALVAQALALTPNTLLSPDQLRFAARRLEQLPTRVSARIGFRPEADGFARVDVALVERPARPNGALEWTAAGVQTMVDREATAIVPGRTGQGEVWTASARWWVERPRIAMTFTAPRVERLPGVWRVEAAWDAQHYRTAGGAASIREERTHGAVAVTDWMTANLRYDITAGLDSWNGHRRTASIGGLLERRLLNDRVALSGSAHAWVPVSVERGFLSSTATASFRSSTATRGFVHLARVGIESVTTDTPLAIWPGAGEGHARRALLRAHPLLREGIVAGPAFGRRLASATVETQRWFDRPSLVGVGLGAFADAAHAAERRPDATGAPFQIDAGVGLRVRLPGREGTLRVDYGRGLRDGSNALTIGWMR